MTSTVYSDTPRARGDTDAPHVSGVTPAEDARTILINKISWGAVLAGVAVSLVAQLVLNMIGIGIGASTLDPMTGDNPAASSFSIGAGIWWALSGILAAFVGGYVASRLSGRPKASTGAWHGLTAWAATTWYFLSAQHRGRRSRRRRFQYGERRTRGPWPHGDDGGTDSCPCSLANVTDPFASIEQSVRGSTGNDPAAMRDGADCQHARPDDG